jgi:hypothetical protein
VLNKDEELRVASFIDCLRDDVVKEREDADLSPKALLWLAVKCKDLNDELKAIAPKEKCKHPNSKFRDFPETIDEYCADCGVVLVTHIRRTEFS